NALTEVCVLSDVLNIVQEKKYMVLDPVTQSQATPKPTVQLLAKRKNLSSAADIIAQGTKRMETAVQERVDQQLRQGGQKLEDFHSELIGLRQRWKLKKTGSSIMGDLTYRSAGSQFWNPGLFEVSKANQAEEEESPSNCLNDSSLLEVKVGSDLEGVASVTVSICETGASQETVKVQPRILARVQDLSNAPVWQRKLKSAQENIFCKELFTQLSHEAYNNRGPIINTVMGNEIRTEVFPGVDLCITYSHEKGKTEDKMTNKKDSHEHPVATSFNPLEYTLHSLLRRRHRQNQSVILPHPVTSRQIPGSNKRLRIAGPGALRAGDVKSSLERISLRVKVGIKDIHVVCSNGSTVTFTSHVQDLKDFFLTQVGQHQILVAYSIAVSLGWQVLHMKRHLPTGEIEDQGHVAGMVVTSSDSDRTIAIRTGPSSGITVSVKRPHKYTNSLPGFLTDKKWGLVGGSFKEVAWDKVPGRTFVQRFFLLLGVETTP
ncbi:hypothetical protein QZH41_011402, partial [Actinostola sp. cb2023]